MQRLKQSNHIIANAADLPSSDRAKPIRVLHVDDDPLILDLSKQIMFDINNNFEFDSACSVDEAFEKLASCQYDIIVSDYEMPQKSGLQFLKELREQKNEIPFILFTGKGREEVAIKALNLGVDGYFNKQGGTETVYGELAHGIRILLDQYQTKKELLERDTRILKLASQTPGMLFQFKKRPNGTYSIPFTSDAIHKIFGCSPQDVAEDFAPIAKAIFSEDLEKLIRSIEESASHLTPWHFEFRVQLPGQPIQWVWAQSIPEKLEDGDIIWTGYIADITEKKKKEESIKESEERFRKLIENTPTTIYVNDMKGNFLEGNKAAEKMMGYSREELIGKNMLEIGIISEESIPQLIRDQTKNLQGQKTGPNEYVLKRKDGRHITTEISSFPIERQGKVEIVGVARDITEMKRIQDDLRVSEEKYRTYVENSPVAFFVVGPEGKYEQVNDTACRLLGYSRNELLEMTIVNLLFEKDISVGLKQFASLKETGKALFEIALKRKDGTPVYVILNAIKLSEGKMMAFCENITERKKAEEESKFRADLLNHVGQAVIMVDNNRIIRFWNKTAEKLYGYSEEQALGHQINELLGNPPREEAEKVLAKLMAGESWSTEACIKNKDGLVVPVILNRTPLFKEDGEFSGAASITTDITLQKNTEADLTFSLESLSSSLAKIQELNEKLRVIGGLTRHDVRNKLSAVTGYAYLLKKKHTDEADVVDGLSKMEQAVKDSMKIFEFAKMYEQLGVEELTNIDVETKITEATTLFSGTLPKIINKCQGLTVLADSFLRQMFYNFVDNTIKYGKKTTTIKVHYKETDQNNLTLTYEDDGVGISTENKSKIFSEGFSTGGSTGFGLFLTKKMTDIYGWSITEEGEQGKGAKFVITIPSYNKDGKENYKIIT